APRTIEVVITRHGPIIDSLPPLSARKSPSADYAIALRWVGHDVGLTHRAMLQMNRAKSGEEFVAALADCGAPSLNFVWADRAGNIGYQLAGQIPIRKKGVGAVPVPGWNDDHAWTGLIPPAELPHSKNPKTHFLATANNQITGSEYPHFLGHDY